MLTFVYDHDAAIAEVVKKFAPDNGRDFGNCKTIGVVDESGDLRAGFVYHHYASKAKVIEMGAVILDRRVFNRSVLRRIFEYPFLECGCQLLIAHVHADDEMLLSQMARLNFDLTVVPRFYGRGDHGVLCALTDDQWAASKFSRRMYRDELNASADEE